MSATRRATLTALASLGAAVVAPKAIRPAVANTNDVADLAARYKAAHSRLKAALDAEHEAEMRIVDPEPPKALYAREDEPLPMRSFIQILEDGRGWLGDEDRLERWHKLPANNPAWLFPGALERRDELIAALDAWNAAYRAAEDAAGATAATAEFNAADVELHAVQAEIVRLRSRDPAVQRLKLLVLADSVEGTDYLDVKIETQLERRYSIESAVALSIARDLAHRSQSTADVCGHSA